MRLAFLCVLAACTASSSEVSPPRFDFYYPTGLAISPTPEARHLFVLNANSDLRYDAGTIQVLDLDRLDEASECHDDERISSLRDCPTTLDDGSAAPFVVPGSAAKTGNFGSAIAAQALASGAIRVFATVRGDPSITWADFDGTLHCGAEGELPRCSEENRLNAVLDDALLGKLPPEPFSVYADGDSEHVFVTHLTTGLVSLVQAPLDGGKPRLHDILGGLFNANSNGALRALGVAVKNPGDPDGLAYVTSSSEAHVATIHVVPGPVVHGVTALRLAAGPDFFLGDIPRPGLRSDQRGIAFDRSGTRAYVVAREPAELLVLDTSDTDTGAPRNEIIGGVEVCAQAAAIVVADFSAGLTAWLPCFATGQVWVIDLDHLSLDAVIDVGRGPNAIVADELRRRVYVANYAEDTVTVIQADPSATNQYAPVLRLGKRRGSGGGQ